MSQAILSLVDVCDRQQYRRNASIIEFLYEQALLNKCTINELLGVVLKQVNYHNEELSNLGDVSRAVAERNNMGELQVFVGDRTYKVTIECQMTMIDGKMRGLLTGLG